MNVQRIDFRNAEIGRGVQVRLRILSHVDDLVRRRVVADCAVLNPELHLVAAIRRNHRQVILVAVVALNPKCIACLHLLLPDCQWQWLCRVRVAERDVIHVRVRFVGAGELNGVAVVRVVGVVVRILIVVGRGSVGLGRVPFVLRRSGGVVVAAVVLDALLGHTAACDEQLNGAENCGQNDQQPVAKNLCQKILFHTLCLFFNDHRMFEVLCKKDYPHAPQNRDVSFLSNTYERRLNAN